MLGAVGVIAAGCGWLVSVRDQANHEASLAGEIYARQGNVYFERWGPEWLDFFVADRYRRRIVAVHAVVGPTLKPDDLEASLLLLEYLAKVPGLRYLMLDTWELTPEVAGALGAFRKLHSLGIENCLWSADASEALGESFGRMPALRSLWISPGGRRFSPNGRKLVGELDQVADECMTAVGKASQLESLTLAEMDVRAKSLGHLEGLTNLKSLTLDAINRDAYRREIEERAAAKLIPGLRVLSRLQSLALVRSCITDEGLEDLASLPSLRELTLLNNKTLSIILV
ncbi:MAG: hypothetical protein ACREHD_03305, partial [Pirellulales bacterium]